MIEETRYKETSTDVDRSRMPTGSTGYVVGEIEGRPYSTSMVKWGAIWAGVVIALGVQVILTLLGMAIGLSVLSADNTSGATPPNGLGVGAGIWWILSSIVSLFLGGWATGFFTIPKRPSHGAIHGFMLWCVVTALSTALVTLSGGAMLGGGLGAMGTDGTGRNAMVRSNNPNSAIPSDNQGMFDRGNTPSGSNFDRDLSSLSNPARQTQAAGTGAGIAWWTFATLVLSAAAAAFGGSLGPRTAEDMSRRRYS